MIAWLILTFLIHILEQDAAAQFGAIVWFLHHLSVFWPTLKDSLLPGCQSISSYLLILIIIGLYHFRGFCFSNGFKVL